MAGEDAGAWGNPLVAATSIYVSHPRLLGHLIERQLALNEDGQAPLLGRLRSPYTAADWAAVVHA